MMRSKGKRRSRNRRRGTSALELALFAPVLLYLLLGVVDFSRYYLEISRLGHEAELAARTAAQQEADGRDESAARGAGASLVHIETFCACPADSDGRFACGTRSCGSYGEPARYVQASAEQPFSFLARYPGIPATLTMRRKAGFRTR